jgi:predicted permease
MAVSGWVPAGGMGRLMDGGDAFRENRGIPAFRLMGRLARGKTIDDARAQVGVIVKRLIAEYPAEHKGTRALVVPENHARPDPAVSEFLPVFAVIFAAMVALVLLIACANVANLMMSRAISRQRDLVIRAALGCGRMRLIRFQLVESLVLAAAAGVLGFLLSDAAGRAMAGFAPAWDIPIVEQRPWDWRVSVFTLVVSIIAGLGAGLWPARRAARFDIAEALKDGGNGVGASRHALRNLLVVAQVTLSLVVLVSAGLFLHSLRQMQTVALGFRPDGILMMSMDLGLQQYGEERGRRFVEDLLARAEQLPGVASATVTSFVPFHYGMQFRDVSTGGVIPGSKDGFVSAAFTSVGPRFFETTGGVLARGRALDVTDGEQTRHVAVINETMARTLWPGEDAIGKRFLFGRGGNDWIEVVGIARDGKYVMLAESPRAYCYLPMVQHFQPSLTLMVRSASDLPALVAPLKQIVGEIDPGLPVYNARSMDEHIRSSVFGLMPMRAGTSIAGVQGFVGLLLAVMGLYAVVSHAVSRRTREIGIRMALGAERLDVLRLVVREGMRLSLVGIATGLVLAAMLGLILSKVLYGLAPVDATVFAGVTLLLVSVCALACYVPARRATRVDPLVALRHE